MKKLLWILLPLLLAGCSFSGDITNLDPGRNPLQKLQGAEFNSGHAPRVVTPGGYIVTHSVGNFQSQLQSKTADNHKVFLNLQGEIASENE